MNSYTTGTSGSTFEFSTGFWWDGTWHEVRPSHGDDDGPPTGVREPRRPGPTPLAPAATTLDHADA